MKPDIQLRSACLHVFAMSCVLWTCAAGRANELVVSKIDAENQQTPYLLRAGPEMFEEMVSAYSARATLCNTDPGNVEVSIDTSAHPMIAQGLYRAANGRFEQIGLSWTYHVGVVTNEELCTPGGCGAPFGTIDTVYQNCGANLSGLFLAAQFRMGPRAEVNPVTALGQFPFSSSGTVGPTSVSKLLQVRHSALNPALNPGARYFIEVQVLNNEAAGFHGNVSSREVQVHETTPGTFELGVIGTTQVGSPAIAAWASTDPGVQLSIIDIPNDGRVYLASRAAQVSPTRWRYNWSVYNQDSRAAISGLEVPSAADVIVDSTDFFDVSYHSGDGNVFGTNFSGVDWPTMVSPNAVNWQTSLFSENPNANAIRWGTTYSFEAVTNSAPTAAMLNLNLYRDPARTSVMGAGAMPGAPGSGACCLANGTCSDGTELSCQESGGVYQGDSTNCGSTSCAQPGDSILVLETASDCPGDSNGAAAGDLFEVELWMRDLATAASGYQAFLRYDPTLLSFRDDLSSYSAMPFGTHLVSIADAEVAPGLINLDGSSGFGGAGTSADSLLATLTFEILDGADCQSSRVQFRQNLPFQSELSDLGQPLVTLLVPTAELTFDDVEPIITTGAIASCYPDLASAEAAAIAASPATDNCTAAMSLDYTTGTIGDPCSTTILVTVMDACGNAAETSYSTRIDSTAPVLSSVVDDISVVAANGTCEAVVEFSAPSFTDNCTAAPTVVCTPPSGSIFPAGTTQVVCVANDECGNSTEVSFDVFVDAVHDRLDLRIDGPLDCYEAGDRICVDLVMTCLDQPVTGFNAFIHYDADLLNFIPAASSYTDSPFPVHISSPLSTSIMGADGVIAVDGSVSPEGSGSDVEAVLVTLCFDVRPGMGGQTYAFDFAPPPSPTIGNELSVNGSPVPTTLLGDSTFPPMPRLRLVTITPSECYLANDLVCVELQMVCLGDQEVTGFNAFLNFDPDVLRFESGSYTNSPFSVHLSSMSTIAPDGARLTLDGSVPVLSPGTNQNSVLATLCFRVQKFAPGTSTTIEFGPPPTPSINSELSNNGVPVPTILEPAEIPTQSTMGLRVCYEPMEPVCVLLEATCLDVAISGYTAEVIYDNDALEFLPGLSGYEPMPFTMHMANPITPVVMGSTATVSLDGELPAMSPLVLDDTVLASLCFNIRPGFEASGPTLAFLAPAPGLESRFLVNGDPIPTFLRDSPAFGLAGDINLDGIVDFSDLSVFTDVLLNVDIDEGRRLRSDLNCDARSDGLDITEFVGALLP